MNREVWAKVPPRLAARFRADRPEGDDEEMVRAWWRSIVCMTCGGCCHSSLIPITADDFDRFAARLGVADRKEAFARAFLADTGANAPVHTVETRRHGGRCMLLEKQDGLFACSRWDQRADVCADFFCWPMTRFALYDSGEPQEMFDTARSWDENFLSLFDRVVEEMSGALFADDLFHYIRSQKAEQFAPVAPEDLS
ncbi:MAG: YkgJ family cysteine cluster protein [Nitrospinae bacterium]|nr:YkgJ family cysteine cluster protein [Nitrospinota bacterium]